MEELVERFGLKDFEDGVEEIATEKITDPFKTLTANAKKLLTDIMAYLTMRIARRCLGILVAKGAISIDFVVIEVAIMELFPGHFRSENIGKYLRERTLNFLASLKPSVFLGKNDKNKRVEDTGRDPWYIKPDELEEARARRARHPTKVTVPRWTSNFTNIVRQYVGYVLTETPKKGKTVMEQAQAQELKTVPDGEWPGIKVHINKFAMVYLAAFMGLFLESLLLEARKVAKDDIQLTSEIISRAILSQNFLSRPLALFRLCTDAKINKKQRLEEITEELPARLLVPWLALVIRTAKKRSLRGGGADEAQRLARAKARRDAIEAREAKKEASRAAAKKKKTRKTKNKKKRAPEAEPEGEGEQEDDESSLQSPSRRNGGERAPAGRRSRSRSPSPSRRNGGERAPAGRRSRSRSPSPSRRSVGERAPAGSQNASPEPASEPHQASSVRPLAIDPDAYDLVAAAFGDEMPEPGEVVQEGGSEEGAGESSEHGEGGSEERAGESSEHGESSSEGGTDEELPDLELVPVSGKKVGKKGGKKGGKSHRRAYATSPLELDRLAGATKRHRGKTAKPSPRSQRADRRRPAP
jgi:hypothetical protein